MHITPTSLGQSVAAEGLLKLKVQKPDADFRSKATAAKGLAPPEPDPRTELKTKEEAAKTEPNARSQKPDFPLKTRRGHGPDAVHAPAVDRTLGASADPATGLEPDNGPATTAKLPQTTAPE